MKQVKPFVVSNLSFIILLLWYGFPAANAQDAVFSQFYAAPLQLNPAFVGKTQAAFIALNHRRQWPGLTDGSSAYVTSSIAYDQFVKRLNSGFGIGLLSDNAGNGIYKKNTLSLFYGYRLRIVDELFAKIGIEGSLTQSRLDWQQLVFYDQLDPITGPGENPTNEIQPENLSKTFFDVSTGFLLYNPRFYVGVNIKHMNTPDEGFLHINDNLYSGLPARWVLHAGTEIMLDDGNKRREATFISPTIMLAKQGDFAQVNAGIYTNIQMVIFGAWFRHTFSNSDAAIAMIGFKQGIFKIAYSYDLTISSLTTKRTNGTQEISLTLNFDALYDRTRPDYNDCFNLFR